MSNTEQHHIPEKKWKPSQRKKRASFLLLILTITAVITCLYAWNLPPFQSERIYTNNAYIRGKTTLISPRVSGYVTEVLVSDFDEVKQGQALIKIDDAPYRAKVLQAQANLEAQQTQLDKIDQAKQSATATLTARRNAVKNAQTQLNLAQINMRRFEKVKSAGIAQREYDQAQASLAQAQSTYSSAQAQLTVAEQDLLGVETNRRQINAAVEGAKASLALAQQDLSYTTVYAPSHGKLGEVSVKMGQLVANGSSLMFLIPTQRWVIANYKETDTSQIRIGQAATISVDALDGQTFTGKVADIAPATASEFSVIRSDSGTGNFIKIAQRIPVKIEFDEGQDNLQRLAPGMSVETRIDTSKN